MRVNKKIAVCVCVSLKCKSCRVAKENLEGKLSGKVMMSSCSFETKKEAFTVRC